MRYVSFALCLVLAFAAAAEAGCGGKLFSRFRARREARQQSVAYLPPLEMAYLPPVTMAAPVSYRAAGCTCVNCQCAYIAAANVTPTVTYSAAPATCYIDPLTGRKVCR